MRAGFTNEVDVQHVALVQLFMGIGVALFRTAMAYSGRYRVDGGRFITKIDSSWNEAWNGTEQERFYKLDGDTLEVSTAWMPNPLVSGNPIGRAILSFSRE